MRSLTMVFILAALVPAGVFAGGLVGTLPAGMDGPLKITEVALSTSAWTALPTTPLSRRRVVSVHNDDGAITIKINGDNTAGNIGIDLVAGEMRTFELSEVGLIYGRSASGTPTVTVEEIADSTP